MLLFECYQYKPQLNLQFAIWRGNQWYRRQMSGCFLRLGFLYGHIYLLNSSIMNQTHHFTPFSVSNKGRDIAELPTPQNGSERYSIFGNFLVRPYVETVLLTKLKWITFKAAVAVYFHGVNNTATTISFCNADDHTAISSILAITCNFEQNR